MHAFCATDRMRPYEELLVNASQTGRILKRENIYGSGPPVDHLCQEAQKLVATHCTKSVVDFGAGCGALQQYLPSTIRYLGIESDPNAVEMAKQKGRNVVIGDVTKTDLPNGSFDVCAMLEVLEHIDDYERVLAEVHRVTASKFIMTVPNIAVLPATSEYQMVPWHLLEATHVNFFTPGSLEKMLKRFFRRVQVWEINQWFRPGLFMNIAAVAVK
jgi:2-polyprenyl-3-methyl-5-hydroxy-6-metoxy-1,4-benzoquinol methylase